MLKITEMSIEEFPNFLGQATAIARGMDDFVYMETDRGGIG